MATGRLPDPNSSPLTAKGDLYTYSTVPAKLAVGSNGETLVADSSATTGLRWQSNFAAGKNKVINGDFFINQRNFSTSTTFGAYGFDRWRMDNSGGTCTYSAQTFTAGAAPVAGYEARNFARIVTSSQSAAGDYCTLIQPIEDVRTFAGQTITVSFWAKAASGTPKIGIEMYQEFGAGGSPSAGVSTPAGSVTISTSWVRYSVTVSVPSISGKTIGTTANSSSLYLILWQSSGSTNATRASSIGIQNNTFDFWGVQVEAGNTATAFQTATGTLAGELAACQRYYYLAVSGTDKIVASAYYVSTTQVNMFIPFPTTMRTAPTLVATSGTDYYFIEKTGSNDSFNDLTIYRPTQNAAQMYVNSNVSGVAGYAGNIQTNNASASVAFNSEL